MEVLLYPEMDPVDPGMEKHTPLFRHASGEAFRREEVAATVKRLMASIGLDPAVFGAHSLRIGGATAALAAGIQPTLIRVCWGGGARTSARSTAGSRSRRRQGWER